MGQEKEKTKTNLKEQLALNLEKVKSTGQLMRQAKWVLRSVPEFVEQVAVAAYLHMPWIGFTHNEIKYLVRFDKTEDKESLFLTRYLQNDEIESIQVVTEGLESEQEFDGKDFVDEEIGGPRFRGVSYMIGKDKVPGTEYKDEETGETSWLAEFPTPPITGEDALPDAKRILRELLQAA